MASNKTILSLGETMNSSRVVDCLDAMFADWNGQDRPGAVIAIRHKGKLLNRNYGMASIEYGVPNRSSTIFRIASVTKPTLSTLTFLLESKGVLDTQRSIADYLPELGHFCREVSIRHLLRGTSGIRDYYELLQLSGVGAEWPIDMPQILDLIARQRSLQFTPGQKFVYSNSGYLLLAHIIERVTGEDIGELFQRFILRPLGLSTTRLVRSNSQVVPAMATAYIGTADGQFKKPVATLPAHGGGGLVASIDDLIVLAEAFDSGALGHKLWDWLVPDSAKWKDGRFTHGHGMFIGSYRGLRFFGYPGLQPGYRTYFVRYPDAELTLALIANIDLIDPLVSCRAIVDAMLPDAPADDHGRQDTARVGRYVDPNDDEIIDITERDGRLSLEQFGSRSDMRPHDGNQFIVAQSIRERSVSFDNDEAILAYDYFTGLTRRYDRYRQDPHADGMKIEGKYWNPELSAEFVVSRNAIGQVMRIESAIGHTDFQLSAYGPSRFVAKPLQPRTLPFEPIVKFLPGASGSASALLASFVYTKQLRADRRE